MKIKIGSLVITITRSPRRVGPRDVADDRDVSTPPVDVFVRD